MSGRTTWTLLILVLLTGGFIWFFERRADSTDMQMERARYALRLQPERISRIQIESGNLRLQLARQGEGWFITSPMQTAADGARVDRLLTQLLLLPRSQIITAEQLRRKKQKPADYGLDQPRWRIAMGDRDGGMTLLVGRDTPAADGVYMQVAGRGEIVVTSTNLLTALPAGVADFRDRRLLPGRPDEVARLELRSRAGFVQAVRSAAGSWQVTKPVTARADAAAIQMLLERLFTANIADFEASSKVGASLYGLDEPVAQCAILLREGAVGQAVMLGKTVEGRTNLVYATKQGDDEIYTVDADLLAALTIAPDDLRDRRLFPYPPQLVAALRIEDAGQAVTLERTNGAWFVTSPRLVPADPQKMQLALAEWSGARVRIFNDQPGTNLAALGFAPPARKIVFAVTAPAAEPAGIAEFAVEVGSTREPGALRAVRVTGDASLLHIDASTLVTLPSDPLYYRDPAVLFVDTGAVRSIVFETGGRTNSVTFDASNTVPAGASALLAALQPLRARELTTEDTTNLERYGLQPPRATLTLTMASTGTLGRILLLGGAAPAGGCYAAIQGQDLVFVLDERDAGTIWKLAPPPR